MSAFPVLLAAAVIAGLRIGIREAARDQADPREVMPRVRIHRGHRAYPLARAAHVAYASFVALGVTSLLVMALALAAALAG
jgi:hypothetical protein